MICSRSYHLWISRFEESECMDATSRKTIKRKRQRIKDYKSISPLNIYTTLKNMALLLNQNNQSTLGQRSINTYGSSASENTLG